MRHGLSCTAASSVVAQQYRPVLRVILACCRRKDKTMFTPIIRFLQRRKQYGHDVQVLSSFSDQELADMGINRCDIDRIARGQSR